MYTAGKNSGLLLYTIDNPVVGSDLTTESHLALNYFAWQTAMFEPVVYLFMTQFIIERNCKRISFLFPEPRTGIPTLLYSAQRLPYKYELLLFNRDRENIQEWHVHDKFNINFP